MKNLIYNGPKPQCFSSKVNMGSNIDAASVADPFGLVVMTSKKGGVSLSWGEVLLRLEEAAKDAPEFQSDIRAMLDRVGVEMVDA